jgi:hypothetical protein
MYSWSARLAMSVALAAAFAGEASGQGDSLLSPTYGRRVQALRGIAVDVRMAEDFGLRPGSIVRLAGSPGVPGDSVQIAAVFERKADPAEVARRERRGGRAGGHRGRADRARETREASGRGCGS